MLESNEKHNNYRRSGDGGVKSVSILKPGRTENGKGSDKIEFDQYFYIFHTGSSNCLII